MGGELTEGRATLAVANRRRHPVADEDELERRRQEEVRKRAEDIIRRAKESSRRLKELRDK